MYAGGVFFATSSAGAIASPDGLHWWRDEPLAAVSPNAIIYANGDFLAVSSHGVFRSVDGLQWQAPPHGLINALVRLAYGNGLFIVCDDSTFWTSSDAANWTLAYEVDPGTTVKDLAFANGWFVAVVTNGAVLASADGTNWTKAVTPPAGRVQRLATAAGNFLAVCDSLSASADGLHWAIVRAGVPALHGITYGNGHFLAVGDNGAVLSSDTLSDDSPVILAQPQSHTVSPGTPLTLNVSAQSSLPLSYQWRKDGQPIPGGNSPTLTLPAVQAQDAGRYTVSISNGSASVTSAPAQVLVAATGPVLSPLLNWRQMPGVQLDGNDFYSVTSGWSDGLDGGSAAVVVVGDNGAIYASVNSGPWTEQFSGTTNALTGVTFGRDQFVAVGDAGHDPGRRQRHLLAAVQLGHQRVVEPGRVRRRLVCRRGCERDDSHLYQRLAMDSARRRRLFRPRRRSHGNREFPSIGGGRRGRGHAPHLHQRQRLDAPGFGTN